VAGGEVRIRKFRDGTDDRQTVPRHRSPAVPSFLGFTIDRSDKIRSRATAESAVFGS
jgi:hypothetical protein